MKKIISCTLVFVCVLTLFAGCMKPEKKIVGTWNGQAELLGVVTEYSFTFNEDGTGKMTAALDIGVGMTYAISGDELSITTAVLGISNTTVYKYAFDKNTLTLTDGSRVIVLTKEG